MNERTKIRQTLHGVFSGMQGEEAATDLAVLGRIFLGQPIETEQQRHEHNAVKTWLQECGFVLRLEQVARPLDEEEGED